MKWFLAIWAALAGGDNNEDGPVELEPKAQPQETPDESQELRDYGLLVRFSPQSTFRSSLANSVYSALIRKGEILWCYPNVVIAEDGVLACFFLSVRSACTWTELVFAVHGAVAHGEISEVLPIASCYEDPAPASVRPLEPQAGLSLAWAPGSSSGCR